MILYGKPVATKIYEKIKKEMEGLNVRPFLAIILVGDNPASLAYVHLKEKIAAKLGFDFKLHHLPDNTAQKEIENLITNLNLNKFVSGIVVQLPLPGKIESEKIIQLVERKKDIDGFWGQYPAPTAQAILGLLSFYQIELKNKKIVIVGHGRLVGQPLAKILKDQKMAVTVCDSKTANLKAKTLEADILITATGVASLITPEMVKPTSIVIDAGASEVGGKMVGDVAPAVYEKIETYTPNPGGVGPVTVAELFKNLVEAAKK